MITMKQQATIKSELSSNRACLNRQLWIKSGAYRTIPFRVWYDQQVIKLVDSWFR